MKGNIVAKSIVIILSIVRVTFCFRPYPCKRLRISSRQGEKNWEGFGGEFFNKLLRREKTEELSEADKIISLLEDKDWRSSKVKYLTYEYRPWRDSWKEMFSTQDEDTICIYTNPKRKPFIYFPTAITEPYWSPWLWTKVKAERFSFIYKHFEASVDSMSVQEHIELDCFFSEYDFPIRWGRVRMLELDTFFLTLGSILSFVDVIWFKPTDLGPLPDLTLRYHYSSIPILPYAI